jgi:transcriptional regulator GlxA family with amidase domain
MSAADGHGPRRPIRIAILAFPGCQTLDVIGPLEVFAEVNRQVGEQIYAVEVVSNGPGPLIGCSGLGLVPTRTIADPHTPVDTLLAAGGPEVQSHVVSADEESWILQTVKQARRFGSICSGAFIMAQTGLLSGKRVTTHWSKTAMLASAYPDLIVEPDAIYICDGPVWTSAGVTAGLDLALALVEGDCGRTVALDVARHLVVYLKRSGGQSQFSAHLSAQMSAVPAIESIQVWVAENLTADLSVDALAKRAGMSPRNFSRIFLKETGATPRDFVEAARTDLARRLIADGVPLERVASQAGFKTISNLRRAFARRLMTTPSSYRENFSKDLERQAQAPL